MKIHESPNKFYTEPTTKVPLELRPCAYCADELDQDCGRVTLSWAVDHVELFDAADAVFIQQAVQYFPVAYAILEKYLNSRHAEDDADALEDVKELWKELESEYESNRAHAEDHASG